MWSGSEAPFDGKHYHLARTLNSPQVLSRPHPPILIGGAGEKKTLRLVARYADACNIAVYDPAQAAHKLEVLREHCATEGRDYGEIEKTAQTRFDLGENGENVQRTIESLHAGRRSWASPSRTARCSASARTASSTCSPSGSSPRWRSSSPPATNVQPAPPATNVLDVTSTT